MDVHLLVYDLSQGLARQMSMGLLGFQLDAIYHTSIELDGLEYVYDGNVVAITPGSSHLGRPLQRLHLGKTELPMEVIHPYLDSLREIYTVQAYDLWKHNCNNFSNDFATFLLGKGIPDHILHMPDAVLQSPMGRMLMPALNQQVEAGRQSREGIWGIQNGQATSGPAQPKIQHQQATVRTAASSQEFDSLLASAQKSCAVVFFTSATCAPCKMLYPLYDELAAEVGDKAVLVKVDISQAFDVGSRYSVRATPTFITFLHGKEENRWSGADQSALRGNVQLLVQMAHPVHPHASLRLPSLQNPEAKPVLFTKIPPLQKLLAKMGTAADHEAVKAISHFIEARSKEGPANDPLPDMPSLTAFLQASTSTLPPELMFTVTDLLRCGLVDPRLSGVFAEEKDHATVLSLLSYVNGLKDCPYALRLVTLQMACNLFTTPLYPDQILTHESLRTAITGLISASFLDDNHSNVRVAAASLLFNVALANNRKRRTSQDDALPEADQIELAASLLEAIAQEGESTEALQGMLLALGYLAYLAPLDGELVDLLRVMAADDTVKGKKGAFKDVKLVEEVGGELLGKGLRRP
ncbi:pul domain-containing protein [Diaporthe amygdali]|uniref:pul domain-containing protein n=1 Tax=Phomopsis amygdali TaxID=1214568 RepID=UPI0022FE2190|nr:pul domain-containing protein [Diaporthe amygdali]KAJ0108398.1 pul domain-containing protein [Diaporthe amygdali]